MRSGRSLAGMLLVAAAAVLALIASDLHDLVNRPSR